MIPRSNPSPLCLPFPRRKVHLDCALTPNKKARKLLRVVYLPIFREAPPSFGGAGGGRNIPFLSAFREAPPSFGGAGGGPHIPHLSAFRKAPPSFGGAGGG